MTKSLQWIVCGWLLITGAACQRDSAPSVSGSGQAANNEARARPDAPVSGATENRVQLGALSVAGQVREVTTGGTLRVERFDFGSSPQQSEQSFLAVIKSTTSSGEREWIVKGREVGPFKQGALNFRLAPGVANRVKVGDRISLYSSRHLPPGLPTDLTLLRREPVPAIAQTHLNVQQIVRAVHGYHNQYNCLPPSVLRGPDGKPWHSWRVLILPFMGEQALYDEYRLAEPWDSPHNLELLKKTPDVFRDPAYGEPSGAAERNYTHYAVVAGAGESYAFPSEGLQFHNPSAVLPGEGSRRDLAWITEGTAQTALIGVVGPKAKIPWTKPLDLPMTPDFPGLGQPGGFATPYHVGGLPVGVFGFFDGSVHVIPYDTKAEALRALLTIKDGKFVLENEVPHVLPKWWLTINSTSEGTTATLACDPAIEAAQPYRGETTPALARPVPQAQPADHPVNGRVIQKGRAFSGMKMMFHSQRTKKSVELAKDGSYSIRLPADKYRVTFPDSYGILDPKYAQPDTTPLSVVVRGGENTYSLDIDPIQPSAGSSFSPSPFDLPEIPNPLERPDN